MAWRYEAFQNDLGLWGIREKYDVTGLDGKPQLLAGPAEVLGGYETLDQLRASLALMLADSLRDPVEEANT